jgi:hypothetical protein
VAQEAKVQARDLFGEARGQVQAQARVGQQKATDGIRTLSRELREMADGGQQPGTASEIARQAADRADRLADWLGQREPGDLIEEIRSFARRRPGAFLLGAALAGTVVGRLTRGAVDSARTESEQFPRRDYDTPGYSPAAPRPFNTPVEPRPYTPPVSPQPTPGGLDVGLDPMTSAPTSGTHTPRPGARTVGEYIDEIDRPPTDRPNAGPARRSDDPLDPFEPGPKDSR